MHTILLTIAFDGTNFSGWQRQNNAKTIQGEIEAALMRLTLLPTNLHSAGRTDAGVHAVAMTAHFSTESSIQPKKFQQALNRILPGDIRIVDAHQVADTFHARYDAKGKEYHYTLFTGDVVPPEKRLYVLHQKKSLNEKYIQQCLLTLLGTHDFSSFENNGSRDKTITGGKGAVRTIHHASYQRIEDEIYQFNFQGDGFLRNMVRNLVGSLLEVGRGKQNPAWLAKTLELKDRTQAGPTAPAHGLRLYKVFY